MFPGSGFFFFNLVTIDSLVVSIGVIKHIDPKQRGGGEKGLFHLCLEYNSGSCFNIPFIPAIRSPLSR